MTTGYRRDSGILSIEGLTKTYRGGKTAVSDLSLDVLPGEIHAFIGRNGAGKTTTLRAAVGLMDFDSGTITIDGHSIRDEPVLCKRVLAYIPDSPDLYDYVTGMQYLDFVCDVYGVSEEDRRARIDDLAGRFGLTDDLGNLVYSYSHGMKQKLAIIGALVHSPRLLVLDEPFVGLDPESTHTLKVLMREMCDDGCAVFFSTHVLDVAERLCDTVSVIRSGRLVASGRMDEVRGDGTLEDAFLELMADGQRDRLTAEDPALRGAAHRRDSAQGRRFARRRDVPGFYRPGGRHPRFHGAHGRRIAVGDGVRGRGDPLSSLRVPHGVSRRVPLQGDARVRLR